MVKRERFVKACLVSFNGLGEEGKHAPAIAPLILRPIFVQAGWECDIFDVALLACNSSITDTAKLINTVAGYLLEFDLIGISTRCDTYPLVLSLAREVKERRRQIHILLGGPQATATARDTLRASIAIDFVIKSEAEASLPKLLAALEGKKSFAEVPGLVYRGIGGLIQENSEEPLIKDLGARPFPDYYFYARKYTAHSISFHEVELGRGCPFKCNFCFTTEMWRREYRVRPPTGLAKELQFLKNEFGTSSFHLIHDNLIIKKGEYIDSLIKYLSAVKGIRWGISSRMDTIDTDLIPLLAEVGLSNIFIGIETGNSNKKIDINKRWTASRCQEVVAACHESNVSVTLSFIVGFPQETRAEIESTICFAIQCLSAGLNTTIQLHAFALEAGTPLLKKHISELYYSGYRGDHIRIPWELDDTILDDIKSNPCIYSTFFSLKREDIKLPYAVQDILGPALNLFRKTFLKLLELKTPITELVSAAIKQYELSAKPQNRGLYAFDFVSSLVSGCAALSVQRLFSFEACCYLLTSGCLDMALEVGKAIDFVVHPYSLILSSQAKIFSCSITDDESSPYSKCTIKTTNFLLLCTSESTSSYSLRKLSPSQFLLLSTILRGVPIDDAIDRAFRTFGRFSMKTANRKEYLSQAHAFVSALVSQGVFTAD